MSLRLLAITAELVLAVTVTGWGILTAVRPALWDRHFARWWVGWTSEPVGPWEGVGVSLAGAGMALSGAAAALTTPTPAMPLPIRVVQLTGLGVLVVAGVLLAVVHPTDQEGSPSDGVIRRDPRPEDDAVDGGARGPGAFLSVPAERGSIPVLHR